LPEILNIIQFANNRDKFINEFEVMNIAQAVVNLMNQLPKHLKDLFQTKYKDQAWVKEHFSKTVLQQEIESVRREELTLFIKAVFPTLTNLQKEKIAALL
jgi:hypothetical protein